MKKNKMMRLASVLLVAVLLSTSVISGTFAKYVTTDEQFDTARVAKWGVVASVSGDLFGATYAAADENTIISYNSRNGGAVSSSGGEDDFVVAPGTENKKGMTITVSGTPEVSAKVVLDSAEQNMNSDGSVGHDYTDTDIYLAEGKYGVMVKVTDNTVITNENVENFFWLSNDLYIPATENDLARGRVFYELHDAVKVEQEYHPLNWFVDGIEIDSFEEVKTELKNTFDQQSVNPNETFDLRATVGWSWNPGAAWEDDDTIAEKTAIEDKMDTILGNMIADYKDNGDYVVVCQIGDLGRYATVKYRSVPADLTNVSNFATYAFYTSGGNMVDIACLTTAFSVRITVEQVD